MELPADYQAALDYIFNYVDYERRRSVPYTETAWDLNRARRVLAALGDPQTGLRYVHVAGSKGKGSTAAVVESVLRASGLRTGFYTSPHLHTFRERIRVDGGLLRRDDLVRLLEQCRPAVEAVPGITTFEIITVLALLHFAQQQVDWVVLETGLGGRLDATNIITPAVSVITPISLEHTALLGDTRAKIAAEKAGIIKPGVPVVVAPQAADAMAVFERVAEQQHSRLVAVERQWQWRSVSDSLDGQEFDVEGPAVEWDLDGLRLPLLGAHQLSNAVTAIAACWELAQQGAPISEAGLRRGVATVVWPARLEVLQRAGAGRPAVVVDSAHNVDSARLLRRALAAYFPGKEQRLVFGASNDKDVDALLAELAPGAERVIVTRSRHPRACETQELARQAVLAGASGPVIVAAEGVHQALALALEDAGPRHVVCVGGSLFVAGEAREAWLALHPGVAALPAGDWAYEAEPMEPGWQVAQTAGQPTPVAMDRVSTPRF